MPTQTSYGQEWAIPTRDQLQTLGLVGEEIDYALEIWDSVVSAYVDTLSGNPGGFDNLAKLSPIGAKVFGESMASLYGDNAWQLPDNVQEYMSQQEGFNKDIFNRYSGTADRTAALTADRTGKIQDIADKLGMSVDDINKLPQGIQDALGIRRGEVSGLEEKLGLRGRSIYELPEEVESRIGKLTSTTTDRTMRELNKVKSDRMKEINEKYARDIGPGYETSTPYRQAVSEFEKEFNPMMQGALDQISERESGNVIGALQNYAGLGQSGLGMIQGGQENILQNILGSGQFYSVQNLNRILSGAGLSTQGLELGLAGLGLESDILGKGVDFKQAGTRDIINTYLSVMGEKSKRAGMGAGMYEMLAGLGNQNLGNLTNLSNLSMQPTQLYGILSGALSPYDMNMSWGKTGTTGGGNEWGNYFKDLFKDVVTSGVKGAAGAAGTAALGG